MATRQIDNTYTLQRINDYPRVLAGLYDEIWGEAPYISQCIAVADELPGSILDVGCGTGALTIPLLAKGRNVVGIDVSKALLIVCAAKCKKQGISPHLIHGDISAFENRRTFDNVFCVGYTLQHLTTRFEIEKLLGQISSITRKNGRLVVDFYDPGKLDTFHYEWKTILETTRESDSITVDKRITLIDYDNNIKKQKYRVTISCPGRIPEVHEFEHSYFLSAKPCFEKILSDCRLRLETSFQISSSEWLYQLSI